MIGNVFLGKAWHWLLLILASGILWWCGSQKLHVIEFNLFVAGVVLGTVLALALILNFHGSSEQVTREKIIASEDDITSTN